MKGAAYYDEVYRGEYARDEGRVQFVADLCRGKVLDVGCGDGILATRWGGAYMGVDFSQEAINKARNGGDNRFVVRDFLDARPLSDTTWDTIVVGEVLEHLSKTACRKLLKKVKAALAPGGQVIATVPNGASIPDPSHVRTFENGSLEEAIKGIGPTCGHAYSDRYAIATAHAGGRPKLSCVLIVKNEEELLGKCLESMKDLWDELVIVDTGSTDGTVEIAESYGARMGRFAWRDDFGAARRYAEALCAGEYVYWQDADEVLLEGHDIIREIVEAGAQDGIAPYLIMRRDSEGRAVDGFVRQEMLHKNDGSWKWHGAAHNWLSGTGRTEDRRIVIEHLARPSGDRPNHTDIFEALRANFTEDATMEERNLFYLMREHRDKGHYREAIALVALMMQTPPAWPLQRSRACIIAGDCWRALGNAENAAQAYHKALVECADWAEPYFCLGRLRYEQQRWREGAAWLHASTGFEPTSYFTDLTIYDWLRYDLLAVCLSKLGRNEEARLWGAKALAARPDDEHLKTNMVYYQEAAG